MGEKIFLKKGCPLSDDGVKVKQGQIDIVTNQNDKIKMILYSIVNSTMAAYIVNLKMTFFQQKISMAT